jgi:putative DNA primase/helicase
MVVHWIECVYGIKTTEERVGRELNVVADFDRYSPVRDYLAGLTWDKKPRLDRLMSHYLHAEDVPLHKALGRCWMISAVARAFEPGCKVDTTLILVGEQGSGKSTAAKVLASPRWFSDSLLDIHSKDLFESIHGVWIYELAELDAFSRSDWPKIKATLSSPSDRYRRPYGKSPERRARSVVFIGTTNRDDFLGDPTGSRRFWCVRVGASRIAELTADRDQLWAEAVHEYRNGVPWHLTEAQAQDLAQSNRKFETPHPWSDVISDWLESNNVDRFRMCDLLADCLGPQSRNAALDSAVCGGILRRMGWSSKQETWSNGTRANVWRKR